MKVITTPRSSRAAGEAEEEQFFCLHTVASVDIPCGKRLHSSTITKQLHE